MHNVFLVDDEIVVREGIRNSIDWSKTNFNLIGEAQDGEMALSIMNDLKPDILITDIKIPFMDGLELSKIVKKSMPWIKIIIISGYDDFDFAKEAISIGVDEYLLKPIDSKELLATLHKVACKIEDEKRQKQNIEMLREVADTAGNIKKEQMFTDLVLGLADVSEVLDFSNDAKIEILAKQYLVVIVQLEVIDYDYKEYLKAINYSKDILHRDDVIFFTMGADRIIIIILGKQKDSNEETAYEISAAIKHEVERQTACVLRIAIGCKVERLSEISTSFAAADEAIKYMATVGIRKIISTEETYKEKPLDNEIMSSFILADKLKYANKNEISEIVSELLKNVNSEDSSVLINYHILFQMILFSSKIILSLGGNPQDIIPETQHPYEVISKVKTQAQLTDIISSILERTFDFRDSYDGLRYTSVIRKARSYIEENYGDPDISLKVVAAVVSLSPNHFSTVFSQETGETFIEYLTKVRVNKAKELLKNTNLRSTDVAFSIGYSESHYFSYIFKKNTGITPREYRSSCKEG